MTAATLCTGLGTRSRCLAKMSGMSVPADTFMTAHLLDCLELLIWLNTKDGRKGQNRPQRRTANLILKENNEDTFDSPEDFEAYRAAIFNPQRGDIDGNRFGHC